MFKWKQNDCQSLFFFILYIEYWSKIINRQIIQYSVLFIVRKIMQTFDSIGITLFQSWQLIWKVIFMCENDVDDFLIIIIIEENMYYCSYKYINTKMNSKNSQLQFSNDFIVRNFHVSHMNAEWFFSNFCFHLNDSCTVWRFHAKIILTFVLIWCMNYALFGILNSSVRNPILCDAKRSFSFSTFRYIFS